LNYAFENDLAFCWASENGRQKRPGFTPFYSS